MSTFLRVLGHIWCAPLTFVGLVYVLALWALRWYTFHGVEGDSIVWVLNPIAPAFFLKLWSGWGGHTVGAVIVMSTPPMLQPDVLVHEQRHTLQCMRLGIFQPIFYWLCMLAIVVACPSSKPYLNNFFEEDARRAAGEQV